MKCVCPMGGDRTCPDDCLIAAWHGLPDDQKTKERRRPAAKTLYSQGYSMEQIATQLDVSKMTISRDLVDCNIELQSKRAKTTKNPKGSGRLRGRKNEPGMQQAQRAINTTPEEWNQFKQQALKEGYPSAAAKLGKLIKEPEIARADLSLKAQHKLDIAIRRHQRELDQSFETRVKAEIDERFDHVILPVWRKKIAEARKIYDSRRSITDRKTFNLILKCLHTDTRNHVSDDIVNEAFTRFLALEKYLLNEKESPTKFTGLPATAAEWQQRKQEATAMRRAKRGHANVSRSP